MFQYVILTQAGALSHSDYHRSLACGNAADFDWAKSRSSLEGRVSIRPASSLLLSQSRVKKDLWFDLSRQCLWTLSSFWATLAWKKGKAGSGRRKRNVAGGVVMFCANGKLGYVQPQWIAPVWFLQAITTQPDVYAHCIKHANSANVQEIYFLYYK